MYALAEMFHKLLRPFQQSQQSNLDLADDARAVGLNDGGIEEVVEVSSMLPPQIAIATEREIAVPANSK